MSQRDSVTILNVNLIRKQREINPLDYGNALDYGAAFKVGISYGKPNLLNGDLPTTRFSNLHLFLSEYDRIEGVRTLEQLAVLPGPDFNEDEHADAVDAAMKFLHEEGLTGAYLKAHLRGFTFF